MAENNRNRGSYRTSNQDWNENRGRGNSRNWDDDRNYGQSENRGYGNSSDSYRNREDDSGSAGWQSRYQREEYNRGGGYTSGRHGRHMGSDFDSANYGGDRDYGYSSYYGSGESSGMGSGSGSSYGSGSSGSRGLYDRDYENMGRRGNYGSGSRIGGSNYGGGYSDRDRSYDYEGRETNEWRNRDYNEGRGSGYTGYAGAGYYGSPGYTGNTRSTGRSNYNQGEERGFWDRASDEVASWFGDDDAERRRDRDRQMRGMHKGKGPRNYSRSDDRIKEDINDRLSDDPFVDASDIDVTVSNGEVTLTGTVDDRSNKRRAEDIAESVSGVRNVENRIRVTQSQYSSSTSATNTGVTGTRTTGSTSSQNRESQSSEYRNPEKEKTSGTNSKKDYVTG